MNIFKKLITVGMVTVMSLGITLGVTADDDDVEIVTNTDWITATFESGGLHLETSEVKDFGVIGIKSEKETYYTHFEDLICVGDLRGTGIGWTLTVQATHLEGINELEGVFLPSGTISLGEVTSIEFLGDRDGYDKDPIGSTERLIIDDGHIVVARAPEGHGKGLWCIDFDDDALGIEIDPTNIYAGEYESTLIWVLYAVPTLGEDVA